jgi:hypothetical protein
LAVNPEPLYDDALAVLTPKLELSGPGATATFTVPVKELFPTPNSVKMLPGLFARLPVPETFLTVKSSWLVP